MATEAVPETLVTALCEGAYASSRAGKLAEAIDKNGLAITIAEENQHSEDTIGKFLRENFVAGQCVTNSLASAYLMACDIRVETIATSSDCAKVSSHFDFYWHTLNAKFKGLSALQVPNLIAILSDPYWMHARPDLAAPIARALYLQASNGFPELLWRRANLYLGGFQLKGTLKGMLGGSKAKAASFLILMATTAAFSIDPNLSVGDLMATDVEHMGKLLGSKEGSSVSFSEAFEVSGLTDVSKVTLEGLRDTFVNGGVLLDLGDSFSISTGGSSGVGNTLV